jgi:hypothetical protein
VDERDGLEGRVELEGSTGLERAPPSESLTQGKTTRVGSRCWGTERRERECLTTLQRLMAVEGVSGVLTAGEWAP